MKPAMLHTAYKVTTTRDAYGSYIASTSTPVACHFREITSVSTNAANETIQSDAMAWFDTSTGIKEQDIIMFGGVHYRVQRVTEARRLSETAVQFLKCDLDKYGVIS